MTERNAFFDAPIFTAEYENCEAQSGTRPEKMVGRARHGTFDHCSSVTKFSTKPDPFKPRKSG